MCGYKLRRISTLEVFVRVKPEFGFGQDKARIRWIRTLMVGRSD